jgi:hypothetical protein
MRRLARKAFGWPDPSAPPEAEPDFTIQFDKESGLAVYGAMVSRRNQWDNLLWQVPVLSFTAQAFLFTVALGAGQAWWARIIASLLSINIALLSIVLMGRHRQAELNDAHWLQRFERDVMHLGGWGTSGEPFKASRDVEKLYAGWIGDLLPLKPMFSVWVLGLSLFGLCGAGIIVATVIDQLF